MGLAFADEVGDGGVVEEDLGGEHAAGVFCVGKEALGYDGEEGHGELETNLLLLVTWEYVDNAVNGLDCVVGVEGCEDEVAGFCGGEGCLNGFEVAHFSDENYVGVLAEYVFECAGETFGVGADFTLVDDASLVCVNVLDGVFDGDDVACAVVVDGVDEGGLGGCLAVSGWAGDEDESLSGFGEFFDTLGEAEPDSQDLVGEDRGSAGPGFGPGSGPGSSCFFWKSFPT